MYNIISCILDTIRYPKWMGSLQSFYVEQFEISWIFPKDESICQKYESCSCRRN